MTKFLQFYRYYGKDLREAIGGSSCFTPDQRLGAARLNELGEAHAKRNDYDGYQLRAGDYRNSRPVDCIIMLESR